LKKEQTPQDNRPIEGDNMRIIVLKDRKAVCAAAAKRVAVFVEKDKRAVLGLATGGTMTGVYEILADKYRRGSLNFSHVTSFNLDEYCGLAQGHKCGYNYYMYHNFFRHINIREKNRHIPPASGKNSGDACAAYEKKIRRAGGIGLQLLGIGTNGHIAFNEPGSSFCSRTRRVKLAEETLKSNSRYFPRCAKLPCYAVTMGIGTILEAGELLLLACGNKKAAAVEAAVKGPVTTDMPASILQLHPKATLILDRQAAGKLKTHNWKF